MNIPKEGRYKGEIIRGQSRLYGEYLCCMCRKTPLTDFDFVAYEDDEEGYHWRAFCSECWNKIKHLENEDIYSRFLVSPLNEGWDCPEEYL